MPPTVAQNSSPSGSSPEPSGGERQDATVGHEQLHLHDVVAEAALAVVVLAVDVVRDRTAHRDLAGTREHRHPEAVRERGLHEGVEGDAGVEVDRRGLGVDGVDPGQRVMSIVRPPLFWPDSL